MRIHVRIFESSQLGGQYAGDLLYMSVSMLQTEFITPIIDRQPCSTLNEYINSIGDSSSFD